jgi:UDP-N-acetylmuramyl pentapeptide phosphotransferase/UDP-N-acetylglucosamine-1-phosphate transferase
MHVAPVPRAGGTAIMFNLFIWLGIIILNNIIQLNQELYILFGTMLIILFISFLDDCINLSAKIRLLAQVIAALILINNNFIITEIRLPFIDNDYTIYFPWLLALPITLFFIVWMVNLYNFMDGLDGFASGMAIFGFGAMFFVSMLNNHAQFAWINLIITMAVAGFLTFNFPPAKIFLGDVGSASLGFLAAGFAIYANHQNILPLWQAGIIFSPFIFDATITLIKRIYHREKFWQPHRSHYYQRLATSDFGHKKTLLSSYLLMAICSGSVIIINIFHHANIDLYVLIGNLLMYFILIVILENKLTISAKDV